jgi:hypothetical protein
MKQKILTSPNQLLAPKDRTPPIGSNDLLNTEKPVWLLPKQEQAKIPRHVVIRLAPKLGQAPHIVEQHLKVLRKEDAVWLGRIGRPMGEATIQALNMQIGRGDDTRLYLTQKYNGSRVLYVCKLEKLSGTAPSLSPPNVSCLPDFYTTNIISQITLWLKISSIEQATPDQLALMHVASSGQTVSEMLERTRTACIVVRLGKGISW